MDYYEANNTIKQAQDIVFRDKAKKIATKSFQTGAEKGQQAGVRAGQEDALANMQKLADMQAAYDTVQRTPPGLPIDPETASLASDYMVLQRAQQMQPPSQAGSGLGGQRMNQGAQNYMLQNMKQIQDTPNNNELVRVPPKPYIKKAEPTPTTLKALQIAEEALKVGQE